MISGTGTETKITDADDIDLLAVTTTKFISGACASKMDDRIE